MVDSDKKNKKTDSNRLSCGGKKTMKVSLIATT